MRIDYAMKQLNFAASCGFIFITSFNPIREAKGFLKPPYQVADVTY
jgi:hypothetical protein